MAKSGGTDWASKADDLDELISSRKRELLSSRYTPERVESSSAFLLSKQDSPTQKPIVLAQSGRSSFSITSTLAADSEIMNDLRHDLERSRSEMRQMRCELDHMRISKDRLKKEVDMAKKEMERKCSEVTKVKHDSESKDQEIEYAMQTIDSLSAEMARAHAERKALEDRIQMMKDDSSKVESLGTEVLRGEAERKQLEDKIMRLVRDNRKLESLSVEVSSARMERRELEEKIRSAEGNKIQIEQQLKTELSKALAERREVEDKLRQVQFERNGAEQQLHSELSSVRAEMDRLEEKMHRGEHDRSDLKAEVARMTALKQELEDKALATEHDKIKIEQLRTELSRTQAEKKELEDRLHSAEDASSHALAKHGEKEEVIKQMKERVVTLEKHREDYGNFIKQLVEEREQARGLVSLQQQQLSDLRDRYQKELTEVTTSISSQADEQSRELIKAQQRALDNKEVVLVSLQEKHQLQLQEAVQAMHTAKHQATQLQELVQSKEQENAVLQAQIKRLSTPSQRQVRIASQTQTSPSAFIDEGNASGDGLRRRRVQVVDEVAQSDSFAPAQASSSSSSSSFENAFSLFLMALLIMLTLALLLITGYIWFTRLSEEGLEEIERVTHS